MPLSAAGHVLCVRTIAEIKYNTSLVISDNTEDRAVIRRTRAGAANRFTCCIASRLSDVTIRKLPEIDRLHGLTILWVNNTIMFTTQYYIGHRA